MIGIIVAIVAIGAIIVTCMSAGRIPAMTVTAVAAAAAVLVMPPFLSWEVESGTDLIALLFQSLVGLLLAYRLPPKAFQKTRPDACRYSESARYPAEPYSLLSIVRSTMERNADLIRRVDDIEVYGEVERRIAVSLEDLEEVLSDVLRMAFSDSKVQHVSLHSGQQPARDRINVVAEYDAGSPLPQIRLLGRSDGQCRVQNRNWPSNCSATYFDNGHEYVYLISIYKSVAP